MDMVSSLSTELDWTKIFENRLAVMMNHTWQAGKSNYNEQELKELKIK
ncbi:hypothetical protein [Paenibacillus sp. N3.4]|nr:hypothetical protein [Paenibacillus sp. N3.4]